MGKKLNTNIFIEKAKEVHGEKYNYSKVEYINVMKKICIICPIHGEFEQSMNAHIYSKSGCPKCGILRTTNFHKTTLEEFITQSKEIHGNKFDYSNVVYVNTLTKVCIICPEHGKFWQTPSDHLRKKGFGCSKCGYNVLAFNKTKNKDFRIEQANKIHNNKYDYSKITEEKNGIKKIKVCIICPEHGEFFQDLNNHIYGKAGCPKCNESHGEQIIRIWLEKQKIKFIQEYKFKECVNPLTNALLKFDFYLPEYNICIEFDGKQHFEESIGDAFGLTKNSHILTHKSWSKIVYRDNLKNQYCLTNNIKLIRIAYNQMKEINEILEKYLKKD
jgi:very-short-patch-repair endonuclease